jgi:hypothetical protein
MKMPEEPRQGSCYTSFLHGMNRFMCCLQCFLPFIGRNIVEPVADALNIEELGDNITEGLRATVIVASVELERQIDDDQEANNIEHQQLPDWVLKTADATKDAIRTIEAGTMIFVPSIVDKCIVKQGDDQLKPYIESLVTTATRAAADAGVAGVNALEDMAYNAIILGEDIGDSFTTTTESYLAEEESELNGVRIDIEALMPIGLAALWLFTTHS